MYMDPINPIVIGLSSTVELKNSYVTMSIEMNWPNPIKISFGL